MSGVNGTFDENGGTFSTNYNTLFIDFVNSLPTATPMHSPDNKNDAENGVVCLSHEL